MRGHTPALELCASPDPGWGRRCRAPAFAKREVFAADAHRDVGVGRVARPGDGESRVFADLGQETFRRVKAGPRSTPSRGLRVNAAEQKRVFRTDGQDDVGVDGMARLAGGEWEGGAASRREPCSSVDALLV